jgi:hypothetical protein
MRPLPSDIMGAALLAVGASGVLAPKTASGQFGLPVDDANAMAFVRAVGARDMILGALVLAARNDPPSRRRALGFASLAGLADAAAVFSVRGLRPQHVLHVGGFLLLLAAAVATSD